MFPFWQTWGVSIPDITGKSNEAEKNSSSLLTCSGKNMAEAQKTSGSFCDIYMFTSQYVDWLMMQLKP